SLPAPGLFAQRDRDLDAIHVRQLGRQSAKSASSTETRRDGGQGYGRNGPFVATSFAPRAGRPANRAAGGADAAATGEVSIRFHGAFQPRGGAGIRRTGVFRKRRRKAAGGGQSLSSGAARQARIRDRAQ